MPYDPAIIWGVPGQVRTNDTPYVEYQLICSLINTCGECLQYHLTVKRGPWALGLHWGCNCQQEVIKPGATASEPFADFRQILDNMPHDQQVKAIGASNYKLLKKGVIEWKDVVTPSRVRSLREVVSLKQLSIKSMTAAGVKPAIAATAHASVNTPAHVLAAQQRQQLVTNITNAGLNQQQLVNHLARGIAARVSIAPGPASYAPTFGPAWAGGQVAPFRFGSPSHVAELAAILGTPPQPPPSAPPKPQGPLSPDKPPAPPPAVVAQVPETATYREFDTARDADEWAKKNYAQWEKKLTVGQRNAIEDYRRDAWRPLNEGLRSAQGESGLPPSLKNMAKNLDAALSKNPLPESVTVFRSLDLQSAGITPDQLTVGKELIDRAFTSTSLDPHKAWAGQRMEIRVPKGAPAAYVNIVGNENRGEFELLLGRQIERFRVVAIRNDMHKTVVMEAIVSPVGKKK